MPRDVKKLAAKRRRGMGPARLIVAIERETALHRAKAAQLDDAAGKMIKPGEQATRRELERKGRAHHHLIHALSDAARALARAPTL